MMTGMKKQIIMNLPYLIVFYAGNKISWLFRVVRLNDLGEKILYAMNHMGLAFRNPLPSINIQDILIGMIRWMKTMLVLNSRTEM